MAKAGIDRCGERFLVAVAALLISAAAGAGRASAACGTDYACAQTTESQTVEVICGGSCGSYSFDIPYGYTSPTYWRWDTTCVLGCCDEPEDSYYLTSLECESGPSGNRSFEAGSPLLANSQIFLVRGCDGRYSVVRFGASS